MQTNIKILLNKKWPIAALSLVFIIALALTVWLVPKIQMAAVPVQSTPNTNEFSQEAVQAITDTQPVDQLGFLLLGYGGAGHQGGMLSDVIQLVYIDSTKQTIALISIPRDLWVNLPNGKAAKINEVFSLGEANSPVVSGGQFAKQMAATVTGLSSNYFVAVDFVGFQRLIGQDLKGLNVNVSQTLDDPWYPIKGEELNTCGMTPEKVAELSSQSSGFELEKQFECRYEHVVFESGLNKMEGGEALKYVRSRHGSAGGDFSRSQRQHEVLQAIAQKLLSLDTLQNTQKIFQTISKNITTDLDLQGAVNLAAKLPDLPHFKVKTITLSTDNVFANSKSSTGQYIVIPKAGSNNWTQVQQYIQTQLSAENN